jgi:hypothetical protein
MSKLSHIFFTLLIILSGSVIPQSLRATETPLMTIEDNCNLPAPTGLSITDITPASANAQWNPVAGATGYQVLAKNTATQQVYFNNTTASTSMAITSLPSNTSITVVVSPICPNGSTGSATESTFNTEILIEVIAGSFQGCNSSNSWTPVAPGSELSLTPFVMYEFKVNRILENTQINNFALHASDQGKEQKVHIYPSRFYPNGVTRSETAVTLNDNQIQQISHKVKAYQFENNPNVSLFMDGLNAMSYVIYYRELPCNFEPNTGGMGGSPGVGGGLGSANRNNDNMDQAVISDTNIVAAPNPFQNTISFISHANEGMVNIQLFRIDGTLVKETQTELMTDAPAMIFTEDLPDGMYIAKIQSKTSVKTIKVQKTNPK